MRKKRQGNQAEKANENEPLYRKEDYHPCTDDAYAKRRPRMSCIKRET